MNWIRIKDRLPEDETPVLIVINGIIRIAALYWEHPGFEDTYKAFQYWDDPEDDGQAWEWFDVTHWRELPAMPEIKDDDYPGIEQLEGDNFILELEPCLILS